MDLTTLLHPPSGCRHRRLRAAVAATLLAAGSGMGWSQVAPGDGTARYDAALQAYEAGHYQVAFEAFAALADAGHCEAVRMAWEMHRFGHALYRTDFRLDAARVDRWSRQATCGPAVQAARR